MRMESLRAVYGLARPYWRRSLIALALLIILVFMDLAIPRLIQRIIDEGINQGDSTVVWRTSLLMLLISALSTLFAVGNSVLSVQVGESVARDLRERLFLHIQSFSWGDLDRFPTGNLMVRLSSDASAVQRMVQVSLRIGTRAPLLMIGSLILMFRTDRQLALTMVPLLLVTTGVVGVFAFRMEPMFGALQKRMDRLNTVLQENIAGVRLVKAFVRDEHEAERFGAANEAYTERSVRVTQFLAIMGPILTIFVNIGLVIVIYAGGIEAIHGQMTEGEIIAFTNYMLTTLGPLTTMAMLSQVFAMGTASMGRVREVVDVTPSVQDAADALDLPAQTPGRVVFDGVWFRYAAPAGSNAHAGNGANGANGREGGNGNDAWVLEDISFTAEPGQTVAILGATGSGKSSLVNLIPRFYDVTAGRVLVDGIDVRAIRQDSLLAHIAIVPQETILFNGSVRDNIRYGRADATEDEVIAAARAAQAHDFILRLPDGYESHVEERGVNLSGGQKQRIAIARALLVNPTILILDDSTSAVDVETETQIQAALALRMGGSTRIVVAQRISTVLNADQILVLDQGRIAARGAHRDLLANSPIYREIYESQLGSGPLERAAYPPATAAPTLRPVPIAGRN